MHLVVCLTLIFHSNHQKPQNLGYEPYFQRWLKQRCGDGRVVDEDYRLEAEHLEKLFQSYVPASMDYILKVCLLLVVYL